MQTHIITVVMQVPDGISVSESVYVVDDALGRVDLDGVKYKVTGKKEHNDQGPTVSS